MPKANPIVEFGAGAGIGTLLGLIMGLSASPVVSIVLGALSGGLLVLLGLSKNANGDSGNDATSSYSLRVLGFGLFCSVFLVAGILLRTFDVLAPSISAQEKQLSSCKVLTPSDVRQVLLLKAFGLVAEGEKKDGNGLELAKGNTATGASLPVLFADRQTVCQILRRDQYKDTETYIKALQVHGAEYASFADAISKDTPQNQEKISIALSNLLCK